MELIMNYRTEVKGMKRGTKGVFQKVQKNHPRKVNQTDGRMAPARNAPQRTHAHRSEPQSAPAVPPFGFADRSPRCRAIQWAAGGVPHALRSSLSEWCGRRTPLATQTRTSRSLRGSFAGGGGQVQEPNPTHLAGDAFPI